MALSFRRESLQELDGLVERLGGSARAGEWRPLISAFLAVALSRIYGGRVEARGEELVVTRGALHWNVSAWVDKRFRHGLSDSLWFKVQALCEAPPAVERPGSGWGEDTPRALELARQLGLPDGQREAVDRLFEGLSRQRRAFNLEGGGWEPAFRAAWQQASPPGRLYLALRLIKFHDCVDGGRFGPEVWFLLSAERFRPFLEGLEVTPEGLVAAVDYLADAPRGPNGLLFRNLWALGRGGWERLRGAGLHLVLARLLGILARSRFHHDVQDFKRLMSLVDPADREALALVRAFRVHNDQGCFRLIRRILEHAWPGLEEGERFEVGRELLFLLDGGPSAGPRLSREQRLKAVRARVPPGELARLLEEVAASKEFCRHRLDRWTEWSDAAATRMVREAGRLLEVLGRSDGGAGP
jgi:hypothetical protein